MGNDNDMIRRADEPEGIESLCHHLRGKAAAQADYEARVLATLDVTPAPDVVALVEAIYQEVTELGVIAAGLEPRRQAEIEAGAEPIDPGERVWAPRCFF